MEIQWRGGKILLCQWQARGDAHLVEHLGRRVSIRRPSFGRLRTGLGSTSLATNAYGYQTSRLAYKPFGGTAWFTAVLPTDYGFTGQRFEATPGYIYDFGARYYDPYIGRFISADTVVPGAGNPQALNRYSYVFNNPLKYTDPSGQCGEDTGGDTAKDDSGCDGAGEEQQVIDIFMNPEPGQEDLLFALMAYYDKHPHYDTLQDKSLAYDQQAYAIHAHATWAADRAVRSGQPIDIQAYVGATVLFAAVSGGDHRFGRTLTPGRYAVESIPARGPGRDFTAKERAEIDRIGQKYGCHTCGTKDPGTVDDHFIPDHQPPSRLNVNEEPQRLYPHCLSCSRVQGGEVTEFLRRSRIE